jgi:ketosteroid isomerase-like protein
MSLGAAQLTNNWHASLRTLGFVMIVVLASLGASASGAGDPMATVREYISAFNKGDANGMAAACADAASILDGMPPHVWQGPTACADWYKDVLTHGEEQGASGYSVTLGKPRHVDVTGDRAYVVVPATMTFKVKGQQVMQSGSTFTVALRKFAEGWRITAWAWAKGARG